MKSELNAKLFEYIAASPTAYHACAHTADVLKQNGYTELFEFDKWQIEDGRGYFVRRNGSSIIAFRAEKDARGFMIAASHCDSPCFKVKENAELKDSNYVRLSVERYGGMLCSTWLDRPLSIAGRLVVKTESGVESKLFDLDEPCALIPNVAIHMNRQANDSMSYNAATDMLPLFDLAGNSVSFYDKVAETAGVDKNNIVSSDMYLYNRDRGVEWGELMSAPRLDDLQCAFASLTAFLGSKRGNRIPVLAIFDNEEVGSQTKQGAASTFLYDVLLRITRAQGGDNDDYQTMIASSFMVSCDNAHAIHPNHPEHADKNHNVAMNKGIVIKYNANQKYTSDGISSAIFKLVCERAEVPYQLYCNRADMAGGGTLGNIANTQVSLNTVDIGLAQLAMHSSFETAGAKDTEYMVKALDVLFASGVTPYADGIKLD